MAPSTVRADYDQLQQIASGFSQNGAGLQQLFDLLKQNIDTLRGGDWTGQGATAFFKEMDSSVLPTMDRLVQAMQAAADQMNTISRIMQNAEDAAANALRHMSDSATLTGNNGPSSPSSSGANDPWAGGSSSAGAGSGSVATGGAATGQAATGQAATGTGGPSASATSPAMTPPDTSASTRTKVEQTVTSIGLIASTLSILEAGGAAGAAAAGGTVAAAGVGTTIGALLLPIGAFLLGASIAEQREREEALMNEFKMKLTGSALVDSAHMAAAQLQSAGVPLRELNARGIAAVKELDSSWKDTMHDAINQQMFQDAFVNHGHPEAAWQARYDSWTKGLSKDLASIYANPQMTK